MNKTQLAYIAGLVDGEGCFSVSRTQRKNKSYSYSLEVSITIREKFILEDIQREFGGSVSMKKAYGDNDADCWRWRLRGENAYKFARKLFPYIQVKNRQCNVFVNIGNYLYNSDYLYEKNDCAKYYARLRKYNTRGPERQMALSNNRWLNTDTK